MVAAQHAERVLVFARGFLSWSAAREGLRLGGAPHVGFGGMFVAGFAACRAYVRVFGVGGIADLSVACSANGGSQPRPFGPSCAAGSVLYVGTFPRELGRNQVLARSSARAPSAPHRIQVMPLLVNQYPMVGQ